MAIPFAGGMAELPHIGARTILVNDLHRHVINLARVVADPELRASMMQRLRRRAFHPDELKEAQEDCKEREPHPLTDLWHERQFIAEQYFVCCWMGRSGKAGLKSEFNGRPAVRWKSDGGDSMVRYRSAIKMLATFSRTLRRCTFETMDAFAFLKRCEDDPQNGIYADPPFPGVGRGYRHNAGQTAVAELAWHTQLRDALERFSKARVVARFYDHPLVRELYREPAWQWRKLTGRKQTNEDAPEVLLMRNGPAIGAESGGLF